MATTKTGKFSSFTCDFSLATSSSSSIIDGPSLTFNNFLNFCQKVPELSPLKKSHFCVGPFYFPLFAKKSGLHFLFLPAVGFLTGFNTAAASMRLPPSSIATVCQILFLQKKLTTLQLLFSSTSWYLFSRSRGIFQYLQLSEKFRIP